MTNLYNWDKHPLFWEKNVKKVTVGGGKPEGANFDFQDSLLSLSLSLSSFKTNSPNSSGEGAPSPPLYLYRADARTTTMIH